MDEATQQAVVDKLLEEMWDKYVVYCSDDKDDVGDWISDESEGSNPTIRPATYSGRNDNSVGREGRRVRFFMKVNKEEEPAEGCSTACASSEEGAELVRQGSRDGISRHGEYSLSDGTVVKGKRGITFAGFHYPPGRIQRGEPNPDLNPVIESIESTENTASSPVVSSSPEVTLPENPTPATPYILPELSSDIAPGGNVRASTIVGKFARWGATKRALESGEVRAAKRIRARPAV